MKRFIRLDEIADINSPHFNTEYTNVRPQAIAALIKSGLRWDNATGIMRNNQDWLEKPSVPSQHVPHSNYQDVMDCEFSRYINNACSRYLRGYSFV